MLRLSLLFFSVLLLAGCQTPAGMHQLENENNSLKQRLDKAEDQINALTTEQQKLSNQLTEANRVIAVLGEEKAARVSESSTLRGQIRRFVQEQIDAQKTFLVNSNLLDYVGGELVQRSKYDNRPLMLVDMHNKMPAQGVITGIGGYFVQPTEMVVKVMRQVQDNLVVIWESKPITIRKSGLVKVNLPVSVGVEKDDILGYYFPTLATVSFDQGTAETLVTTKNLRPGNAIGISSLGGKDEKRAYSLGVYALLK